MMSNAIIWTWYLSIPVQLILLSRLALTGIWRRYRLLFLWISMDCAWSLATIPVQMDSEAYVITYSLFEIALVGIQIAVTWGIFRIHLREYPNIGRFGLVLFSLLLFAGLSTAVVLMPVEPVKGLSPFADRAFMVRRLLGTSACVFLALASLFFAKFGVRTRFNIVAIERLLAVYFLGDAAAFFLLSLPQTYAINAASGLIIGARDLLVFGAWAFLLRPAGELMPDFGPNDPTKRELLAKADAEAMSFLRAARATLTRGG